MSGRRTRTRHPFDNQTYNEGIRIDPSRIVTDTGRSRKATKKRSSRDRGRDGSPPKKPRGSSPHSGKRKTSRSSSERSRHAHQQATKPKMQPLGATPKRKKVEPAKKYVPTRKPLEIPDVPPDRVVPKKTPRAIKALSLTNL